MILTFRYRIKDATTAKRLRAHARAVNYVWNYCGEIEEAAMPEKALAECLRSDQADDREQRAPRFA